MGSRKHPKHPVEHNTLSGETHRQIFERLSKIKNMHGHPGPRKPKKG